jgi:asparagine synthase (glutamine-hydrolysing)
MCGINGLLSKGNFAKENIEEKLSSMNDQIIHRGPDENGFYIDNLNEFSLGMAIRRLSIIDISTGQQPIFSEDKQKVIVFNGEIYNYKVLKEALINTGTVFYTNSDTEVILKLYEKEGMDAFSMLDGMFAFNIYDKTLNKIFIVRDFFGEKPLYYAQETNNFYWASELKSIINVLPHTPSISKEALNIYFQLTYIPAPFTIYNGISKLEANCYIEYDCLSFEYRIKEIKQRYKEDITISDFDDARHQIHNLVQQSVQSRTVSDVPIGTFLSGGVDSSIVSLCVAQQTDSKIDTFSVGFEKKEFDESDNARTVAKLINSNHHEFVIGEKDLAENIEFILLNFDEPFADSSALASYLVANRTADFVKVALTGDGGDEVFGGYNKYYMGKLNRQYTSFVPSAVHNSIQSFASRALATKYDKRGLRFKLNKLIKAINYSDDFYYNIISLGFHENELEQLLKQSLFKNEALGYYKDKINNRGQSLTDFRNIDLHLSLEGDVLVKVDRTSMVSSLECRAPFLNKDLWHFTTQLPESYLIKGWDKKYILKKAFEQYFPKGFLNNKKKGFGVPVGDWLRLGLKDELLSFLEKEFIDKQNLFKYEPVKNLIHNHLDGKIDNTFRVWTYYCFQKWYQKTYGAKKNY